jgi:hypothetical protein
MLLLYTLKQHFLLDNEYFPELLKLIEENIESSIFSIHKFLEIEGEKNPGEWFSPGEASNCIAKLLLRSSIPRLAVLVSFDSIIYSSEIYAAGCDVPLEVSKTICKCGGIDEICQTCGKNAKKFRWVKSVLVFMPLMLGAKRLDPKFFRLLKFFLYLPYCVGIIGGKVNSALYIIGFHDESLIALDPHIVKTACRSAEELRRRINEFSTEEVAVVKMKDIGSSMSVGLYFKDEFEFCEFQQILREKEEVVQGVVIVREAMERISVNSDDESDSFVML